MYKVETIRQVNRLLDATVDGDNPVNEVFFNDKEKRIEIWSMLADDEKMIASASYTEEQGDATPNSFFDPAIPKKGTGFGGSFIPPVLKAVAKLMERGVDLLSVEFVFDDEREMIYIRNSSDEEILGVRY